MSVLDRNGLGEWLADRLVEIGDSLTDDLKLRVDVAARSVPGRAAPGREPARGAADPHREEPALGRREAGQGRALPEGRRGRGRAPRHLGDRQVAELRHRQPRADAGRGPVGVGEPGARQPLGPLRSRHEPARHASQGGDPGGGQRVDGHRPGQPERVGRSRQVRRASGRSAAPTARSRRSCTCRRASGASRTRTASSAPACCTSWPGTPARRRRPTPGRTSGSSRRRCGSSSRAARPST